MYLGSLYRLTDAQNLFLQRNHVSSAPFSSSLCICTDRAGYSKDINMKTMTIYFIVRTGHDWSKSSMLQRLCARPPCQEQVAEESTIWHKCLECDPNEHNWFTTTWYPCTLWGPAAHIEALRHKSAHGDVSTVLINEIHHLYEMHGSMPTQDLLQMWPPQ